MFTRVRKPLRFSLSVTQCAHSKSVVRDPKLARLQIVSQLGQNQDRWARFSGDAAASWTGTQRGSHLHSLTAYNTVSQKLTTPFQSILQIASGRIRFVVVWANQGNIRRETHEEDHPTKRRLNLRS